MRQKVVETRLKCKRCHQFTQTTEPIRIHKFNKDKFQFTGTCYICNCLKSKNMNREQISILPDEIKNSIIGSKFVDTYIKDGCITPVLLTPILGLILKGLTSPSKECSAPVIPIKKTDLGTVQEVNVKEGGILPILPLLATILPLIFQGITAATNVANSVATPIIQSKRNEAELELQRRAYESMKNGQGFEKEGGVIPLLPLLAFLPQVIAFLHPLINSAISKSSGSGFSSADSFERSSEGGMISISDLTNALISSINSVKRGSINLVKNNIVEPLSQPFANLQSRLGNGISDDDNEYHKNIRSLQGLGFHVYKV